MTILPPFLDDQYDSIAWSRTDSGVFTLASAYKSFAETSWATMIVAAKPHFMSSVTALPHAAFGKVFCRQILRRNDFPFANACSSLHVVYRQSLVWGLYYGSSAHCSPSSERRTVPVSWVPPPAGWLCLNTDAAISTVSSVGTVGGLIRNSSSAWIFGYCKNVGHTTPSQAELWGLYIGLKVEWNLGVERLQIQSDSKHAIDLILLLTDGRPLPLVQTISSMRCCAWCTEFIWVPRECNMVVDSLSRLSIPPSFDLTLFDEVPTSIA
ncbi:hypothetical protein V6N12_009948 [Hibiscus sabdariffa]|uniref:RNase H type-1 domain-containing protein n=1 Tax=Hibiscus sabdariffa TaxID=183260 RepID=A0ABR2EC81_9ROSI